MTIAAESQNAGAALDDLAVGDRVVLKRNLDHPAWMKQVPCDPRNGADNRWIRDPEAEETISATISVTERREVPSIAGWGGREAKTLVRLPNGFWYDCATGLQDGSGATLIEALPAAEA